MTSAGRILIIPKGNYDSSTTYEMLDLVYYNGVSWLAKKTVVGIEPSAEHEEYWHKVFDNRIVQTFSISAGSTLVYTLEPTEACVLFAYYEGMEYSAIFTCCGVNESCYSIQKNNEASSNNAYTSTIGSVSGVDLNQITFANSTEDEVVLHIVKTPLNLL